MTRRPVIWAYLGDQAGPIESLAQDALDHPETEFLFASADDRATFRRRIEDAMRKSATDRQLVETARMLKLI